MKIHLRVVTALTLLLLPMYYLATRSYAQSPATSQLVTWTCTGSPCPWGSPLSGQAAVWPAELSPQSNRLGYTVSAAIYLPESAASGMTITISSGTAAIYAGLPDAVSHRLVTTLVAGQSFTVTGLAAGEVISLQNGQPFTYALTLPANNPTPSPTLTPTVTATPPSGLSLSQLVTWTCTSNPCPWGSPLSGQAAVWPAELSPQSNRLGYTVSAAIYLPESAASGMTITISSGTAAIYAGLPDAVSHRLVTTLVAGQSFTVTGLAAGEVISMQSSQGSFAYTLTMPDPGLTPTPTATVSPTMTPTVTPTATPTEPPPPGVSQPVTWTCTGSPCPWGSPLSGQAAVWPVELSPQSNRLGYTVSAAIYLPESTASGKSITLSSGTAAIYAGLPDAISHRLVTTLNAGQTFFISGLAAGEVMSLQSQGQFAYALTEGGPTPTATPGACVDPTTCNPVSAIQSYWRCNTPGCTDPDWEGAVISWPSWSAFESNARAGNQSRTVYSLDGEVLYPYMGSWANGCQVTAVAGTVLIIEWQRGTEQWREIYLEPGESHTITLVYPEDGAMIEGPDFSPGFAVMLENCTPQVIDKSITPTPPAPTVTPPATGTPPATNTPPAPTSTPAPEISFPTAGVVDDFNRANGSLGPAWGGDVANYAISANQLIVGTSEDIYWNSLYGANQEVYVTLSNVDANATEIDLILKAQSFGDVGAGQIAIVYVPSDGLVQVWTFHAAGGWVQHGSNIPVTFNSGDQFGARAWSNGLVELFRNGELLGTTNVSGWSFYASGGYIGLFMIDASAAVLDDFGGGNIVLP